MRSVLSIGAMVLGLVIAATACGGKAGLDRARGDLGIALQATNAARDGLAAWSKARQEVIVESATSLEAGKAALAEHRKKRAEIDSALVAAYSLIALASSSLVLYDAGKLSEAETISRFVEAAQAVREVVIAVAALRGNPS